MLNLSRAWHVASWREKFYAGLLPDKMLATLSVDTRAAAWAKIMQEPAAAHSTVIFVAEHEGTIIAFGSCGAQRTDSLKIQGYDGEVSGIYVLREFQKRMIGLRLFSAMSANLQQRGFSAAALWVLRENIRARRFYERLDGKVIEDERGCSAAPLLWSNWPTVGRTSRNWIDCSLTNDEARLSVRLNSQSSVSA